MQSMAYVNNLIADASYWRSGITPTSTYWNYDED